MPLQAVLAANFTSMCRNEPEAVTVVSAVCTESPTRTGTDGTTAEFELPTSGAVAAVMKLSSAILLVTTAIAFLA